MTYGVYLNDVKVGWMRSQLKIASQVELNITLHASVAGMGQVQELELIDNRRFEKQAKGKLVDLTFKQKAATGSVTVRGIRSGKAGRDDDFTLKVTAGNATRSQRLQVEETLEDVMAVKALVSEPRVGASVRAVHLDGSLQRSLDVVHTVVAIQERGLAGVQSRTVQVESKYPALGISETSWVDEHGKLLETRVGGFFVARLEPPEVAKRLDFAQDLLVRSVVAVPEPLSSPEQLDQMRVSFAGFGKMRPPSSPRQRVRTEGDHVILELRRESGLPTTPLARRERLDAGLRTYLEPTAFIQSDAPKIRAKAREVIAGAQDVRTIVERLSRFVYSHVRDEYVPAYSNALEALQTRRGDCSEHAVLMVALARSVGLPARVAVGIAYWPTGKGFGWHAWCEIYADGTWYSVDPTWNQPLADVTHVKLADGGPAEQARIVMLLGQLRVVSLEH